MEKLACALRADQECFSMSQKESGGGPAQTMNDSSGYWKGLRGDLAQTMSISCGYWKGFLVFWSGTFSIKF